MGTPAFALPSLSILLDHSYDIPAVVTVPDKPMGRGQKSAPSPVKVFALQRGLTVLTPSSLADPLFSAQLSTLQPDLIVVVAFRILPPEIFAMAKHGAFNLHASLLPKYRGAAPINWAIISGETETGVTTFFLRKRVDTGSVLLQARVRIGPDETAGELHDKLAEVGAEIVLHTVRLIESGKAVAHEQDEKLASGAPKIFKEDCKIDWKKPAATVHNMVRGLSPAPTAWTTHGGRILKIFRTNVTGDGGRSGGDPGSVLVAGGEKLEIQAGSGSVSILELQQEGRRRMRVDEFLRGYPVEAGETFD